jgi:Fe2+ or Zn2+ uptake regulation protein
MLQKQRGKEIMEVKNDKDFIATLRDHGLQVTYQRLAIYQALYFTKDHPSAEPKTIRALRLFISRSGSASQ